MSLRPFRSFDIIMPREFRDLERQLAGNDQERQAVPSSLRMELKETEKSYIVKVDAPGAKKEDIKLSMDNGVLTVSAVHQESRSGEKEHMHFTERTYGHTSRSIRLPKDVDPKKITAKHENGVLTVEIPKVDAKEKTSYIAIQ